MLICIQNKKTGAPYKGAPANLTKPIFLIYFAHISADAMSNAARYRAFSTLKEAIS
jgi:hypothetical protein